MFVSLYKNQILVMSKNKKQDDGISKAEDIKQSLNDYEIFSAADFMRQHYLQQILKDHFNIR